MRDTGFSLRTREYCTLYTPACVSFGLWVTFRIREFNMFRMYINGRRYFNSTFSNEVQQWIPSAVGPICGPSCSRVSQSQLRLPGRRSGLLHLHGPVWGHKDGRHSQGFGAHARPQAGQSGPHPGAASNSGPVRTHQVMQFQSRRETSSKRYSWTQIWWATLSRFGCTFASGLDYTLSH